MCYYLIRDNFVISLMYTFMVNIFKYSFTWIWHLYLAINHKNIKVLLYKLYLLYLELKEWKEYLKSVLQFRIPFVVSF